MTADTLHALLDQTFEDLGLLVGGLAEHHALRESAIRDLVTGLGDLRRTAHSRLAGLVVGADHSAASANHPVIVQFLAEVRKHNEVMR